MYPVIASKLKNVFHFTIFWVVFIIQLHPVRMLSQQDEHGKTCAVFCKYVCFVQLKRSNFTSISCVTLTLSSSYAMEMDAEVRASIIGNSGMCLSTVRHQNSFCCAETGSVTTDTKMYSMVCGAFTGKIIPAFALKTGQLVWSCVRETCQS